MCQISDRDVFAARLKVVRCTLLAGKDAPPRTGLERGKWKQNARCTTGLRTAAASPRVREATCAT